MINKNLKIFLILLALTFFSTLSINAQETPTTYRIISMSTLGNKTIDSKTIIAFSGLQTGQEIAIPSDDTRDAIKRLWTLGLFSDVEIYIDKKVGNDVYLIVRVDELPRIESVDISGNDKFSKSEIEEKIGLIAGQVISEQKLRDIEFRLTGMYEKEGYSMSEVKVDKLISSNNEARIRIRINEGSKVSVDVIKFEGNKNIPSKKLRKIIETSEKVWWKFWDGATFDKNVAESDKKIIVDYYKENGFKDAEVSGLDYKLSTDKKDVIVTFKINEGIKYFIKSIDVTGNKLYADSVISQRIDMKEGDVYNYKKLMANIYGNEAEADVSALYYDNGYLGFAADIKDKVVDTNKVNITIVVSENRQYKVGLVTFDGNDKTKDKVLRRELYTIPGDFFNRSNLKRSLEQLRALNYFNPEKIGQDISLLNDSTVNIKYIVSERSSDQFNASVGYSGSFGFTGAVGLTFNNFDIAEPLSGGGGQILNFSWQFGEAGTYRTFSVGFQEPWFLNTPTLLGFTLYDTRQQYYYDVRETGLSINFGKRFKWPDDFFRGDWTVKFQRTDVINGGGYYQTGLRNQFSIKQTITRSSVFDPIFPLTGTKISNSTELSGGPFLPGNMDFVKNIFAAELYSPVVRNSKLVLYSNFNFYFVQAIGADNYLPPTELFFMGGNGLAYNTIALRGYDDRNVGPKNYAFNPIGGKVALKYGLELRYPLSLDPIPIFVLAFAEAGNVWSDISKTDPFDLRRSVGFGTRLMLPAVGLIGFDFGYGFDRMLVDRQDPKWIFHFQFGRGF